VRLIKTAGDHVSSARIVFVINVDGQLDPLALDPALFCVRTRFDEEKILELRLSKWRLDEIHYWLVNFLPVHLSNDEYELMASSIFGSSASGTPLAVYSSLFEWFESHFSGTPTPQENRA